MSPYQQRQSSSEEQSTGSLQSDTATWRN